MPRPTHIEALDVVEHPGGSFEARVSFDGFEWTCLFTRTALDNRKVVYQLATDQEAFLALMAEHMDRWERANKNWRRHSNAGPLKRPQGSRVATELKGRHPLPAQAGAKEN